MCLKLSARQRRPFRRPSFTSFTIRNLSLANSATLGLMARMIVRELERRAVRRVR